MDPITISNTIQEFQGKRYYWDGTRYFRRVVKVKRISANKWKYKMTLLHRVVWESANVKIANPTMHVHHLNENRKDNSLSNLGLVHISEHISHHMMSEERREKSRQAVKLAVKFAPIWHKSKEGRAWHSIHAKENFAKRAYLDFKCQVCGILFKSRDLRKRTMYCGQNCRMKDYRRKGWFVNGKLKVNRSMP